MVYWLMVLAMFGLLGRPAASAPSSGSGYTATRYPLVLVHGLFGFGRMLGVDYFYRVPEALQKDGARVFVAQVDAVNTSEYRGEQLLAQVQDILAITGAGKVNLIGHSQGAPTARYVAAVRPDLVASVTSVGGVNQGSLVADRLLAGLASDRVWSSAAAKAFGLILGDLRGDVLQRTLVDLSTAGSARFNVRYPAGAPARGCGDGEPVVNGVQYFSWSGSRVLTNWRDPADLSLGLLAQAFSEPSDGLVSRCSSHLGQVIRDDYPMNHADEINQTLGLVSETAPNPVGLYRQQANRLKRAGL